MNKGQQTALVELQEAGYIIHWHRGMYVSTVGKGKIFPVTQEWLDEEARYLHNAPPKVGELIYKDDTYTCIPLDRTDLCEFSLYKELDIEKMVAKHSSSSTK